MKSKTWPISYDYMGRVKNAMHLERAFFKLCGLSWEAKHYEILLGRDYDDTWLDWYTDFIEREMKKRYLPWNRFKRWLFG